MEILESMGLVGDIGPPGHEQGLARQKRGSGGVSRVGLTKGQRTQCGGLITQGSWD
jgi:hypothetical protein